jgi:hypothetical protein
VRRKRRREREPATEPERYVGADLAALLEQVQSVHGEQASIIGVDRIRSGGVAGFFAREAYEVLVEPDGQGSSPAGDPEPEHGDDDPGADLVDSLGPGRSAGLRDDRDAGPDGVVDIRAATASGARSGQARAAVADAGSEPAQARVTRDHIFLDDGDCALDRVDGVGAGSGSDGGAADGADDAGHEGARFAAVLADAIDEHDRVELQRVASAGGARPPALPAPGSPPRLGDEAGPGAGFWERFARARADAELFDIPPVAVTAIVGSLPSLLPVARRCASQHWAGACEVFALTSQPEIVDEPEWQVVGRGSDLVRVAEQRQADFPLLVIDVPAELPMWVRPLLERLRRSGLGLVHYVLDGDPTDEDLATWHGQVGRPSVLDLLSAVRPHRALDLLDRGEPIASIAGVPVSAALLLALRSEAGVGG